MRPYASNELEEEIQLQAQCRGSVAAAKAAIYRRDMYLCTTETDGEDAAHGEYLRDLNRTPIRLEQREDDAFREDEVGRLVMMLPPGVDDDRWMSHTESCFKKSRCSVPGRCRYGFPRARIAQTSCSSDSVALARRAPFEFVSGFNREMMLTFKSNHDIQVMIGDCYGFTTRPSL
ncbi:hypothetical protein F442_02239 [Phytophthora nicotianae P10297]|uniref:Uncharacterized protein n=1 Tax=Phytophthora nicotianae P10297 TaxID=1317064 RepID=W3A0S4_PHYNI|nr:hypothetical protein F442_02239 [Phytophthora nicotianae P10297]